MAQPADAERSGRLPITRAGLAVLFFGIVAFTAGILTRWDELLVLAIGMLSVLGLSFFTVLGRLHVQLTRSLEPDHVTVDERSLSTLKVTNPTGRYRRGLQLLDQVGVTSVPLRIPTMRPHSEVEIPYDLPTRRRGVFPIGPARIVRADPLGLWFRHRVDGETAELRVWPRRLRVPITASGLARDMEGPTSDTSPEGGTAFHTIRQYVPGDDYRHIHWRSTAKTGGQQLMIRQFVDTRRPLLVVALDCSGQTEDESFEICVEIAASLVESSSKAGVPFVLITVGASTSSHVGLALDLLSGVEQSSERSDLPELAQTLSRVSTSAASVVVVTSTGRGLVEIV